VVKGGVEMIIGKITKITETELKDIRQTIKEMFRLAQEYKDDVRHFKHLNLYQFYHFLRDKVKYRPDPDGIERLQRPSLTILYGGDCDDKTIVAMSYFELNGIPYRLAVADYGKGWEHVYAEVKVGSRGFVPFDTSCLVCDMGAERKYIKKKIYTKDDL
jgi:hypothetical protein